MDGILSSCKEEFQMKSEGAQLQDFLNKRHPVQVQDALVRNYFNWRDFTHSFNAAGEFSTAPCWRANW